MLFAANSTIGSKLLADFIGCFVASIPSIEADDASLVIEWLQCDAYACNCDIAVLHCFQHITATVTAAGKMSGMSATSESTADDDAHFRSQLCF